MGVTIIADQGTHLLISDNDRYAIIERRNNRLYNCHDGKREGIPLEDLANVGTILDRHDWTSKAKAQAAFDAIIERESDLGQTMR